MYGKKLKELRGLEGWTQEYVAKQIGVSKQTYSHYENEQRKPGLDMMRKLAKVYNVNLDRVFGDSSIVAESGSDYITNRGDTVDIPIVGHIACGPSQVAYEQIEGYEQVPKAWVKNDEYFFLRARGDSMINARIQDGDLVLIRRQNDVDDGEIAVVMIEDEATLKRVYRTNGQLILQSENSNYEPIIIKKGEVRIIGKLTRVVLEF